METIFKWTEDMSVGEETIDKQHKNLLNQINKIIDAISFGVESKEVQEALAFFDEYIKEHLEYEEKYMEKSGYPGIEGHKRKHSSFIDNYTKFKKEFENGTKPDILILEIERFLGEWWIEHIGEEDKKYFKYLS